MIVLTTIINTTRSLQNTPGISPKAKAWDDISSMSVPPATRATKLLLPCCIPLSLVCVRAHARTPTRTRSHTCTRMHACTPHSSDAAATGGRVLLRAPPDGAHHTPGHPCALHLWCGRGHRGELCLRHCSLQWEGCPTRSWHHLTWPWGRDCEPCIPRIMQAVCPPTVRGRARPSPRLISILPHTRRDSASACPMYAAV